MNTRYLTYIVTIARTGCLHTAARELGISPAALSNYLKRYESELGTPLFLHQKKHFTLTPAGRIYAEAAQRILAAQQAAVRDIQGLDSRQTQTLLIGASPQRGEQTIANVFGRYHQSFPHVYLKVTHTYSVQGKELLRRGRIHLLHSSYSPGDEEEFSIYPLSQEELLLVVPIFHPLASRPSCRSSGPGIVPEHAVDIRNFRDSVYVLYDSATEARRMIDDIFREADIRPSILYETNSPSVLQQLIRRGAGIGFLPAHYAVPMEGVRYYSLRSPRFFHHGILVHRKHRLREAESGFIRLFSESVPDMEQFL